MILVLRNALIYACVWATALSSVTPIFAQDPRLSGASGFDAPSVSMPRSYGSAPGKVSVHVLGEVAEPGTYYVNPNDRILAAIQMAGGPTRKAAQGRVELRRERKVTVISLIDLYRDGLIKNNPFIQENDVIYIPMLRAAFTIQGSVHKPDTYELRSGYTLEDALESAGGFTVGLAKTQPITVIRFDDENKKVVLKVDNEKAARQSFQLVDGDVVHVPHKFTAENKFDESVAKLPNDSIAFPSYSKDVFILGGVNRPGPLPFAPQFRLGTYIALAGGLSRLGRGDVTIIRQSGERIRTNIDADPIVNPGDTVRIGEDKLGPEFWISFMTTVVSISLSAYAITR